MPKKLMLDIPNIDDDTSFYRAIGPLSDLRTRSTNIIYESFLSHSWATCSMTDAPFMQRPYLDQHFTKFSVYKTNIAKPVWLDYDDDLFNVPVDNPTYRVYKKVNHKKNVQRMLERADVVTVSTIHLANEYSKFKANVVLAPNAFNSHIIPKMGEWKERQNIIAWRGSDTHMRDLMEFRDEIIAVQNSKECDDWIFHYIGCNPWYITNHTPHEKTFYCEAMDPMEYHKFIFEIAPAAFFVPLHDSIFNRSKSNIAWIEASFAGSACIAPDWEEWRKPGCLLYKDKAGLKKLILDVVTGAIDTRKHAKQSWDYIQNNLTTAHVNSVRQKVIASVLNSQTQCLFSPSPFDGPPMKFGNYPLDRSSPLSV